MSRRRHLGRVSAEFLTADGSLFNAIQSIIGQKLRQRYTPPREIPPEMLRLLTELDDSEPATERLTSADIEPAK
jgi:hypothetical protein